jgi:P-type conjugative transfer protein TrbG
MRGLVLITVLLVAGLAEAQDAEKSALFEASMRQQWAAIDQQIQLRRIDKEALQVTGQWREGEGAAAPTSGAGGRVVLEYGTAMPRILCSPERLCDIELQAGERFVGEPMIGDQARWIVEPAAAGASQHVVVKPKFPDVSTNLAIYTDRRVYHLELQATRSDYMPFVSFVYPEDRKAKWLQLAGMTGGPEKAAQRSEARSREYEISTAPGNLNFNYRLEREGRRRVRRNIDWVPKRVFDDGEKTIIEMPRTVLAREMPILLVRDGGKDKIVNFRTKGIHFIVDRLFSHAVLVKGVGRKQERVGIYREED